jgi:hypothetical protein
MIGTLRKSPPITTNVRWLDLKTKIADRQYSTYCTVLYRVTKDMRTPGLKRQNIFRNYPHPLCKIGGTIISTMHSRIEESDSNNKLLSVKGLYSSNKYVHWCAVSLDMYYFPFAMQLITPHKGIFDHPWWLICLPSSSHLVFVVL